MDDDRTTREPIARGRELSNFVIYLIGIPAVGKYTTAKQISLVTGAKVVDNQLINLPVFSVLGYDGTDSFPFPSKAWKHIETIREAVLSVIRECSPPGDSFIFTNVLEAGNPGDESLFRRVEQLARDRGAAFFPVWLTCNVEALRERKNSSQRRERFKDTDVTNITRYVKEFEVLKVAHANALTLDTSEEDCETIARRIIDHIYQVQGG